MSLHRGGGGLQDELACNVEGTRLSLDAIKRRMQNSASSQFSSSSSSHDVGSALPGRDDRPPPLFVADVLLVIPKVVVQPNFDSIQATLNKCVQTVIHVAEAVPPWEHVAAQQGHPVCVHVSKPRTKRRNFLNVLTLNLIYVFTVCILVYMFVCV